MLFGSICEKYCRLANFCYSNKVCIFDVDGCSEQAFYESQQKFMDDLCNSSDECPEVKKDD